MPENTSPEFLAYVCLAFGVNSLMKARQPAPPVITANTALMPRRNAFSALLANTQSVPVLLALTVRKAHFRRPQAPLAINAALALSQMLTRQRVPLADLECTMMNQMAYVDNARLARKAGHITAAPVAMIACQESTLLQNKKQRVICVLPASSRWSVTVRAILVLLASTPSPRLPCASAVLSVHTRTQS